jgi:hypothetical protein
MNKRTAFAVELGVNLFLPWLAYRLALPHWGMTGALIASAIPPILWSAQEFVRLRRVDALSMLILVGIALSVVLLMLGGSPRVLLLRESLASGAVGVAFLLSLAMRRPLTFYLARATLARQSADGAARFEQLWNERPAFASSLRLMTAAWGLGLTAENLVRVWMAWTWPVERFLVVAPIVSYSIYGALALWTLWYRKRLQRRSASR